jgi:hypothetical protein
MSGINLRTFTSEVAERHYAELLNIDQPEDFARLLEQMLEDIKTNGLDIRRYPTAAELLLHVYARLADIFLVCENRARITGFADHFTKVVEHLGPHHGFSQKLETLNQPLQAWLAAHHEDTPGDR